MRPDGARDKAFGAVEACGAQAGRRVNNADRFFIYGDLIDYGSFVVRMMICSFFAAKLKG